MMHWMWTGIRSHQSCYQLASYMSIQLASDGALIFGTTDIIYLRSDVADNRYQYPISIFLDFAISRRPEVGLERFQATASYTNVHSPTHHPLGKGRTMAIIISKHGYLIPPERPQTDVPLSSVVFKLVTNIVAAAWSAVSSLKPRSHCVWCRTSAHANSRCPSPFGSVRAAR